MSLSTITFKWRKRSRSAEVHFGGLLTRATRQDESRAGNRLISAALSAYLDKSGQMLDNDVERVRP